MAILALDVAVLSVADPLLILFDSLQFISYEVRLLPTFVLFDKEGLKNLTFD